MKHRLMRLHNQIRQYWKKFMESTQQKMTRGAANISRMISMGRMRHWSDREKKK